MPGGGPARDGGPNLQTVVAEHLLPTPQARDARRGAGYTTATRRPLSETIMQAADPGTWGRYAPAIERWQRILGRPAPDPTEPGRTGKPRLAPRFVEWMMGLPAGWVTDPAIWVGYREGKSKHRTRIDPAHGRNAQLRALGNGVVPMQGGYAYRTILTTMQRHQATT